MEMRLRLLFASILLLVSTLAIAQGERRDKAAVTFEELYDEPYAVNKLFIGFQPIYGEVFATNMNAGFGIEASYYLDSKADFKAHFRMPYSATFYDLNRDLADKNGNSSNSQTGFNYIELGGTYHFKDMEETSKTKMVLYKKNYSGNMWAGRVPLKAEVPAKVRKIYGGRLGAIAWKSSIDVDRILETQELTNADLINSTGVGIPETYIDEFGRTQDVKLFSNLSSTGLYVGGSISWIRNIAVAFDSYDEAVDDGILTLYFDILYAPSLSVDQIQYQGDSYSVDAIDTSALGFRLGIDGKFNRTLSWAYGGEVGYRPSIQGQSFFAGIKISIPVFGTNLDYKVESFGQ